MKSFSTWNLFLLPLFTIIRKRPVARRNWRWIRTCLTFSRESSSQRATKSNSTPRLVFLRSRWKLSKEKSCSKRRKRFQLVKSKRKSFWWRSSNWKDSLHRRHRKRDTIRRFSSSIRVRARRSATISAVRSCISLERVEFLVFHVFRSAPCHRSDFYEISTIPIPKKFLCISTIELRFCVRVRGFSPLKSENKIIFIETFLSIGDSTILNCR